MLNLETENGKRMQWQKTKNGMQWAHANPSLLLGKISQNDCHNNSIHSSLSQDHPFVCGSGHCLYNLHIETSPCKNSAPWAFGQRLTRAFIILHCFMNLPNFLLWSCMWSLSHTLASQDLRSWTAARKCTLWHRSCSFSRIWHWDEFWVQDAH